MLGASAAHRTTNMALLFAKPAKKNCSDENEKNIWKPDKQFRVHFGVSAQCIADDDEEEIADRHDQAHREANRSFAAVRSDAKWHTDNRERDASERE